MMIAGNENHECLMLAQERFLARPDEQKTVLSVGKLRVTKR